MKLFAACFALMALSASGIRQPGKPGRDEGQGHKPPKIYDIPKSHLIARTPTNPNLPKDFTWDDVDGRSYLTPNWNQHIPSYCGGCYLHSTLSGIQDRMHIAKQGRGRATMLARQTFINCGPPRGFGSGCGGGGVHEVLGYMYKWGLPDETCQVYTAKDGICDAMGQCMNCMTGNVTGGPECWAIKPFVNYKIKGYNLIDVPEKEREAAIMSEIYARGPVTCGIYTGELFDYNYAGGVWTKENDEFDHDIEVVGWGTDENGVDYWHIRNSWGSFWGEDGFFKIKRGLKRGVVTYDCWFGVPDLSEEKAVQDGTKVGSMFGLMETKQVLSNIERGTPVTEPWEDPKNPDIFLHDNHGQFVNDPPPPKPQAQQLFVEEPKAEPKVADAEASSSSLTLPLVAACLFGAVVGGTAMTVFHKRAQYESIN